MHGNVAKNLKEIIWSGLKFREFIKSGNRINLVLNTMFVSLSNNLFSIIFFNHETFFQVKVL